MYSRAVHGSGTAREGAPVGIRDPPARGGNYVGFLGGAQGLFCGTARNYSLSAGRGKNFLGIYANKHKFNSSIENPLFGAT